jgi:WD repeat-containing protein 48
VWSLFSDHPNLERFFSGDKAGHLVLTDVTGCRNDYSEGECILLSKVEGEESRRGTEGICQITGIDDEYIWTATGSADVKRWKDVGRKRDRVGTRIAGESRRSSIPGTAIAISEPPVLSPSMPLVDGFIPPRAKTTNVDYPRDTRSVAFADTPKPSLNPFDDNAEPSKFPMGWLGNSRRTSLSGAPTAGSIVSVTSSRNGGVEHLSGRNGISYLNMICLGLSEIPYAAGDEATAKAAHLFSNSVLSFSRSGSGGGKLGPQARVPSVGSLLGHTRTTPDPGDVARRDFEDREVVGEADALRVCPDEVIKGRHGLIRAMTLNDRQHVLTIDTAGQVAVWNVISGKCIGRFAETDISSVYQESGYTMQDAANRDSKEALDIVRERIEGESSTITWCTVDTRIGSLTVHMEENRCFDAEVYADEVGHHNDPSFKEDQRSKSSCFIYTIYEFDICIASQPWQVGFGQPIRRPPPRGSGRGHPDEDYRPGGKRIRNQKSGSHFYLARPRDQSTS